MFERLTHGAKELQFLARFAEPTGRRRFVQWSGITLGVVALGCSDNNDNNPPDNGVSLGSGDNGILNYAYALEQLEAAFYTMVTASFYNNASTDEKNILGDIKAHEVIHRDFFKATLGSAAIADLAVDFSSIDFSSRSSVLGAARAFEDLGVSAYNGAGKLLSNPDNLLVAGKIVSVEARHASAIRAMLQPNTTYFAGDDVVNRDTGLDGANDPASVLATADVYVTTTIDASGLPTT